MQRYLTRIILTLTILILFASAPFTAAEAGYSVGFKTDGIEITTPNSNGMGADGTLRIEGNSSLDRVWIGLRGPDGNLETIPLDVQGGEFAADIQLRFGSGKYTVWADNNGNKFSGQIRFEVEKKAASENRYCTPSAYVDCDHPQIAALAASLTAGKAGDRDKAKAIHGWVTGNISYDYAAYLNGGSTEMLKASEVLASGEGICRDYAILTAALARGAGVQARVVYGQAGTNPGWDNQYHAWNEFLIDGDWVSLDTTWDAGYIQNGSFVRAASDKYLMPTASQFKKTHTPTKYTVY